MAVTIRNPSQMLESAEFETPRQRQQDEDECEDPEHGAHGHGRGTAGEGGRLGGHLDLGQLDLLAYEDRHPLGDLGQRGGEILVVSGQGA